MTPRTSTQTAPKDNKKATAKPPTNGAKDAKNEDLPDLVDGNTSSDITTSAAPSDTNTNPPSDTTTEEDDGKPKRLKKSIFIVVGEIREFVNARDAEAFLNGDHNVPEDYKVIRGNMIERKQKVSLR